jgi:restriction endonuclease S subunit
VAKYLYLLFKSKLGQAILNRFASGSVMPQIPANALENMEIPWPSAKEREKFLQAFDEEEKINKDIEELRAKLNSLHENFLIK